MKVLRAHILPLTNCAFNKSGDKFITGSYDRTCKIFDADTGNETHTLEGHKNVVYAIAFNNPYGDKIITGSFDKTCKLWDANTGQLYYTLRGHATEIVCLAFNPQSTTIATGSMDNTAKLWDVETGAETFSLEGHEAEIVSLSFNTTGDQVVTGSFDHTSRLWDVRTGEELHRWSYREPARSVDFGEGEKLLAATTDPFMGEPSKILVYRLDDDPAKPILALAREARLSKCKDVWEGYNLAHPLVRATLGETVMP